MSGGRVSLKGWVHWWRRRRREFRSIPGVNLAQASNLARLEIRCRAQIAQATDRALAKSISLLVCSEATSGEIYFVPDAPLDATTRERLKDIPELLLPFDQRHFS